MQILGVVELGGALAEAPLVTRLLKHRPLPTGRKSKPASLVLAREDDGDYAEKVISMGTDDKFDLLWVNYPDLARFTRARKALALLHPATADVVA